jgi:GxxExxY protein
MHRLYSHAAEMTHGIIAAAIEVHRHFGPGLLESIYEWALIRELELGGYQVSTQRLVRIEYKGETRDEPLRYDILVNDSVLVEVKAVEGVLPIHKAWVLSYMKLLDVPVGLILNFHESKLTDGISRLILPAPTVDDSRQSFEQGAFEQKGTEETETDWIPASVPSACSCSIPGF